MIGRSLQGSIVFAGLVILATFHVSAAIPVEVNVLPHPQSVSPDKDRRLILPADSGWFTVDATLVPFGEVFAREFFALTGSALPQNLRPKHATFILRLDRALPSNSHSIQIFEQRVFITGGSEPALAQGTVTVLQLLQHTANSHWVLPRLAITEAPNLAFRGLLIDCARQWHDVAILEQLIELAHWYKLNFVQLHLTDNQLFTFPSDAFPELPTPDHHYTKEQLRHLVEFARVRGVTLIPELDVPGHAKPLIERRPGLFGFQTPLFVTQGEKKYPVRTINLGREAAYTAIDTLVAEICAIFTTSPFIHLGGDEAVVDPLATDLEVQAYLKVHDLLGVHELYRHFLVRMNTTAQKHGKRLIIWEGFRKVGRVPIPRDITVMAFETLYQLPQDLIASGYPVINTSWKPLYVLSRPERRWPPEYIYQTWNPYRWENHLAEAPSFTPIQLAPTPQVIGAMMCSWEQAQDVELSLLRERVAAFAERAWHGSLKADRSLEWFNKSFAQADEKLSAVLGSTVSSVGN